LAELEAGNRLSGIDILDSASEWIERQRRWRISAQGNALGNCYEKYDRTLKEFAMRSAEYKQ